MDIFHRIDFGNGLVDVEEPLNFESAQVDVVFTKDKARASFANLLMVWRGKTAGAIFAIYEAGKNGGKGVSSSLSYEIEVCGVPNPVKFDMMLVMGHSAAKFSCDYVELPVWQAGGEDWLQKETQSCNFYHLYNNLGPNDPGKINFSDFKKTPYTISELPNYAQVVSLSFQELVLLWQLKTMAKTVAKDGTNLTTTTTAAGVPITGTEHIVIVVGRVANLILEGAEIVVYLILIGKFMADLKKNVMQSKKYKLCMREQDVWQKLCAYLGVSFSSSIYGVGVPDAYGGRYVNETWMPAKIVMPKVGINIFQNFFYALSDRPEDEDNNPKSFGYPDARLDEYIETMERKYNAEFRVRNGTGYFEEKHHFKIAAPYQLANTGEVGYTLNLPGPFRTNLSLLAPYYEVAFRLDESDTNTLHRYRGTKAAVQIITPFPITKYSGWGQGQLIDLGSSMAKRKDYLNEVEVFFNTINQIVYQVVNIIILPFNLIIAGINAIISVINAICNIFGINGINPIPSIQNPINLSAVTQRIGWAEFSDDAFSEPKTFRGVQVGGDWELHPQQTTAIGIMNDFHGFNLATRGNQYLLFDNTKSKFCCFDFNQILNSNVLVTPDGKNGEFEAIKWTMARQLANDIEYKIQETYLTGLSEKIIIDGTS